MGVFNIQKRFKHNIKKYFFSIFTIGLFAGAYIIIPQIFPISYSSYKPTSNSQDIKKNTELVKPEKVFVATHVKTPKAVKAIYMTQCVVSTPSFRKSLVKLIEATELNSVVIDIKDFTGSIVFKSDNQLLKDNAGKGCRTSDIIEFIDKLHKKGIYVIGRITVFQDPYYTSIHPNLAVKMESATSTVWKDYRGLSFIEPGAKDFWDYIVAIGKESYNVGFDELNFDYIRFPSDGNMRDIYYPFSEERIVSDPDMGKAEVMREFFQYLHNNLKDTGVIMSADLFGMTTTNPDDLNIGQILEYAEPYFDYLSPMVYPSHYPKGFNGWENPNKHVYDVVNFSMSKGVDRLIAASSTPLKLRPWLQDFNYGGNYGAKEVRAQIQATYDAGLTSWMLWNPSNRYTRDALENK